MSSAEKDLADVVGSQPGPFSGIKETRICCLDEEVQGWKNGSQLPVTSGDTRSPTKVGSEAREPAGSYD
jgi:hypothetical protein